MHVIIHSQVHMYVCTERTVHGLSIGHTPVYKPSMNEVPTSPAAADLFSSPWKALPTLCTLDTSSSAQATGLCSTHGTGARTAASQLLRPPRTLPGVDRKRRLSFSP